MVFFIPIFVCLGIQFSLSFWEQVSRRVLRRVYWICAFVAVIFAFFTVYPDAQKGLGMSAMFAGAMVFMAYAYTPYLKVGGKIYSITVQNSRPDPEDADYAAADDPDYDPEPYSYGGIITATKMWWMLVALMVIASGNIYIFFNKVDTDFWTIIIGVGILLFCSLTAGYGDASWDYPIARRQHLQFVLTGIVTAGTFTMLYLLSYYAGKHWPYRNERSMEYRAHPRHRRSDESGTG